MGRKLVLPSISDLRDFLADVVRVAAEDLAVVVMVELLGGLSLLTGWAFAMAVSVDIVRSIWHEAMKDDRRQEDDSFE